MIALIDGDVVVYRVGFASENQTEAQNCMNAEVVMRDVLNAVEASSYRVFLSDSLENNYRFKIDNNYKANRKDARKPTFYDSLRLFLKQNYAAEITLGQEADDALGIEQMRDFGFSDLGEEPGNTVICSIDKDLLQIPGYHYNLSTGAQTTVTQVQGLRHFYKQLLIGDVVDNIQGVRGIGVKKAAGLLDHIDDEREMFELVYTLYNDEERLLRNGRLLWIRREPNQLWEFPCLERTNDSTLSTPSSSKTTETEPTTIGLQVR